MRDGPDQPSRRLAVRVTKDAERQVRSGHPWLFDRSITSISDGGTAGDLAVVFDSRRRFLAIGLYDPDSPIRVRVLHHGDPTPIDDGWWGRRLREILERRSEPLARDDTTAFRWVHGENDQMPGLVVDRYERTLVLKLYSQAWFAHLPVLVEHLGSISGAESVVLRLARNVAPPERGLGSGGDGSVLTGSMPDGPVRFVENGLVFEADVIGGHKTGHFLDQRDNRALVGALAAGGRVLDVFCSTGGFSVHAAAGGATTIHGVDISKGAVAAARRNMELNSEVAGVAACEHRVTVGDAADTMVRLVHEHQRFDLVVVDPPAMAVRQRQRASALAAYRRLAGLAADLAAPGGLVLLASCSARVSASEHEEAVVAAIADRGRRVEDLSRTGQPVDHPVGFAEGAYLKAVVATLA